LPDLWLLSDVRNDRTLAAALAALGEPAALVFRHYHLPPAERRARFRQLSRIARAAGHLVILSGSAAEAARWGADGCYGAPVRLARPHRGLLRIATAHDLRELGAAGRIGADAVMLSPVFATRSHPGGNTLGPLRFRLLARHAPVPVIALGGMTPATARRLQWPRWAAIDGLAAGHPRLRNKC
jgi:thiamine-phosphate pyrophosphorylase